MEIYTSTVSTALTDAEVKFLRVRSISSIFDFGKIKIIIALECMAGNTSRLMFIENLLQ